MKQLGKITEYCATIFGVITSFALLTGCQTDRHQFANIPFENSPPQQNTIGNKNDVLSVGTAIAVTLTDLSSDKIFPTYSEKIKADGTISPPYIGTIIAADKTAGVLQKEIQAKYNVIYKNTTATVTIGERYYYVDGEVKTPGPKLYLGQTDIVSAIAAGGGFTDFAKKSKVLLRHPNGQTDVVNYNQVINDATQTILVYPDDRVVVKRRLW